MVGAICDGLRALHERGKVLVASGPAPAGDDLRQTVSVHRETVGVRVHVETYHPTEWDTEVEDPDLELESFDDALAWLETERAVMLDSLRAIG